MPDNPLLFNPDNTPVARPSQRVVGGFDVTSGFNLQTGRGSVKLTIPGVAPPMVLNLAPYVARRLGMMLLAESETAIGNAIFIRAEMEIHQLSLQDAVKLLEGIGGGTRADHILAYEQTLAEAGKAHEAQVQTDQMEKPPQGGVS